jgi:hypothetical protein
MSRQIDLTKKLNDEDRDYLKARGEYVLIARNDAQFADEGAEKPGDGSGSSEGTRTPDAADSAASDAGSTPDAPPLPEAPPDYRSMKVEDLKAELDRRKAAYETAGDEEGVADVTYSSSDKKDDLITLLEEDDAAVEEDEETT